MNKEGNIEYSVVVPVYNSEGSLKLLHKRLECLFDSLKATWELILINDCSKDKSWNVLEKIAGGDSRVTAINLTNNFGQHSAIMCGLSYAKGDYIITMDDDLQHPPEEIPKLIHTMTAGNYSVVYAQYFKKKHGWFRNVCSHAVNTIISKITGSGYRVTQFRIMNHSVAEKIISFTQHNVMIDVLIKDIVTTRGIGHCLVEHHSREIGISNYSFKKLFAYAINMVFNYTLWPLRFAAFLGFLFSFFSVVLGIYYIVSYFLYGVPVRGWTSIIVVMTFFSGITLFVLGIIGEYVGRIFLNSNHKPQYFVKEICSAKNKQ